MWVPGPGPALGRCALHISALQWLQGGALIARRARSVSAGVRSALADVASRLRGFKVPADKAVIERALKSVAEFRAPGKYFLHEWLHKEAEAAMVQGGQASGGKGLRDPSPPSSEEVGVSERAAAGTRSRQSAHGKRSRESTPEGASPAIKGQQQKSRRAAAGAAAGGEGGRPPGSLSSAPAEVRPGGATGGEGGQTRGGVSGGGATFRTAPAAATPPCPSPQSMERTASGATVATATTTTSNSSERAAASGKRARADGGDGTGGRVGVKRSGATAGRSSSSRGSQEFDDSWIEQHAGRQPEEAAPISSKQVRHGPAVHMSTAAGALLSVGRVRLRVLQRCWVEVPLGVPLGCAPGVQVLGASKHGQALMPWVKAVAQ